MKKNIVILILSPLILLMVLYTFQQKSEVSAAKDEALGLQLQVEELSARLQECEDNMMRQKAMAQAAQEEALHQVQLAKKAAEESEQQAIRQRDLANASVQKAQEEAQKHK